MTSPLMVECKLRVLERGSGRHQSMPEQTHRVPRISRLMALAIRMEGLIGAGGIADYSALAQLGHVSRARITQIMSLLLLAPDIQERILLLCPSGHGRDSIRLAQLQPIARTLDWNQQRRLWAALIPRLPPVP